MMYYRSTFRLLFYLTIHFSNVLRWCAYFLKVRINATKVELLNKCEIFKCAGCG